MKIASSDSRGDDRLDLQRVDDVGFDQLEPRLALEVAQVPKPAGLEVVDAEDAVAFGDQGVAQVGTDEPGAAGDENDPTSPIFHDLGLFLYAPATGAMYERKERRCPTFSALHWFDEIFVPRPAINLCLFGGCALRFADDFRRRVTRANPRDVGFQLAGAMRCRMIGEDALARCAAEPSSLCLAPAGQDLEHRGGAIGDHDLAARNEDGLEPGPFVGYDRRAAGGGLEQPHARAVAGPRSCRPG